MLKALLLDMDETLCDTTGANRAAQKLLAEKLVKDNGNEVDGVRFADDFLNGIYKVWTPEQRKKYLPIREQHGELIYRQELTKDLLTNQSIRHDQEYANALHEQFEVDRMNAFAFFPKIKEFLIEAREHFTLVVITNGPEFSQIPKLNAVNMEQYVDHIIVGGQEPEEKPAVSIFAKALRLANCSASEAIHFGDSLSADITGANNSDIESVWIRHGQAFDEKIHAQPTYTLESPVEIPTFFKDLSVHKSLAEES